MSIFQTAQNETAFLKLGLFGFEGSGKTYTAIDFAIGMAKLTGGKRIGFFDTEKGSDFHIQRVKDAGMELVRVKSHSLIDLLEAIREAEKEKFSFLIADSITHVWVDLCDSYLRKKLERVQKYRLFVNSKLNIATCGRAGFEYSISEDDEGTQEIIKSGTKMKAEAEFGYESDLLLEMFKVPLSEIQKNKKAKGFENQCVVLKDRSDTMNAKIISRPKFKNFDSIIKFLNIGGAHVGSESTTDTGSLFGSPDYSLAERDRLRKISLEQLDEALIMKRLDGRSNETVLKRTQVLKDLFGYSSKTYIEGLDVEKIRAATEQLKLMTFDAPAEDAKPRATKKEKANGSAESMEITQ